MTTLAQIPGLYRQEHDKLEFIELFVVYYCTDTLKALSEEDLSFRLSEAHEEICTLSLALNVGSTEPAR